MSALRHLSRQAALRVMRQAARPTVLAEAPVETVEHVHPLSVDAPAVRLCAEPIYAKVPRHQAVGRVPSETARHGDAINDAAALRAYLMGAAEWGPEIRVVVQLEDGRHRILVGSFGAIQRTLPDGMTLAAWRAAGATEFPVFDLDPTDGPRRVRWLPIGEVPAVAQMERASRGGN